MIGINLSIDQRIIAFILSVCILIIGVFGFKIYDKNRTERKSIFEYSKQIYTIFDIGEPLNDFEEKINLQENGIDFQNYWTKNAKVLMHLAIEKSANNACISILESFMKTFYAYGKFPRPVYKELEYGWVSSMDAPTIAISAQMLYELTGEEKYNRFVEDLIQYIKKDVNEGGFTLRTKEGIWPLEYGWIDATVDKASFVLNGALLGTISCIMLAEARGDASLANYAAKTCETYQRKFKQYEYKNQKWYLYMLNPKTVNQNHYVIFEIRLLEVLYKLTNKAVFETEANNRRNALSGVLAVFAVKNKNNTLNYTFPRMCPPHMYTLDIYGSRLDFYDSSNKLLSSVYKNGMDIYKDGFVVGSVPDTAAYVKSYAVTTNWEAFLGSSKIRILTNSETIIPTGVPFTLHAYDDAFLIDSRTIHLDSNISSESYGRVEVEFDNPLIYSDSLNYTIETHNKGKFTYICHIFFYDKLGNGIGRYLLPILPGKNLHIINILGLTQNSKEINEIAKFSIRYYTAEIENGIEELTIGEIRVFNNYISLNKYIQASDYIIQQQQ